jgi:type I restriction enzyme M protein
MFVQSADFVKAHGGNRNDISVYGQEFTTATWRLAKMNLAIRGIEANLGDRADDSFHRDLHPDLRADYVIANPHFNVSDWYTDALRDDARWKWGTPPPGNGNYAWISHFIHHLSPTGTAGFVLANGSLSSKTSGEGEIRKKMVDDNLVDCIVALPEKLFFNAGIPVCLWFISKDRAGKTHRDRHGEVLFIDARELGEMQTRSLRVLTDDNIKQIVHTYRNWRSKRPAEPYLNVAGFCRSITLDEIATHDYMLTPGRYVGVHESEEIESLTHEKLIEVRNKLAKEFEVSRRLQDEIQLQLDSIFDV